ncbi:uncharacterized protein FYW61_009214 isoform 3-T6 [Anableps anableps]
MHAGSGLQQQHLRQTTLFQLVSHCLMVIMFSLKQAALLFIQLLNMSRVFSAIGSSQYIAFTLPAFGLLLCCTAITVCLCRKCGTRKESQKPDQHQSQAQSGQAFSNQLQGTDQWRSKKHRSDYMERLNSVYGQV